MSSIGYVSGQEWMLRKQDGAGSEELACVVGATRRCTFSNLTGPPHLCLLPNPSGRGWWHAYICTEQSYKSVQHFVLIKN